LTPAQVATLQAVTFQMLANFSAGGAAINVLAREAAATLIVVDAGVVEPRFESDNCEEHGGQQPDSHDLEVRGSVGGVERRIIHRMFSLVLSHLVTPAGCVVQTTLTRR
jgi:NaMN:DMB phosphoribosyltransferase